MKLKGIIKLAQRNITICKLSTYAPQNTALCIRSEVSINAMLQKLPAALLFLALSFVLSQI